MRMPRLDRVTIEEQIELSGFLRQSNISRKNVKRLRELTESPDQETAALAELILEISRVKPHKKRRLKFLARNRPDLLRTLEETGLIEEHHWA